MTIPYNQIDHEHCWGCDNPPCGQRVEHLVCCLCGIPHPSINASILSARKQERNSIYREIHKLFLRANGFEERSILLDEYLTNISKSNAI